MANQKVRVYELSKALDVPNKDVINVLKDKFGVTIKSHSSSIDQSLAKKVTEFIKSGGKEAPEEPKQPQHRTIILRKAVKKPPQEEAQEEKKPEEGDEGEKEAPAAAQKTETVKEPETPAETETPETPEETKEEPEEPKIERVEFEMPRPNIIKKADKQDKKPQEPSISDSAPRKLASGGAKHGPPRIPPKPAMPMGDGPPRSGRPKTVPPEFLKRSASPQKQATPKKSPPKRERRVEEAEPEIKEVTIGDKMTVSELAEMLGKRETEIIKHVFMKGVMVTVNQTLDPTFAKTIAEELGYEVTMAEKKKNEGEYSSTEALDKKAKLDEKKYKNLQSRAPVISIMGHVDHGKTSLLDAIRQTHHKIVDTEAGGITQSIGAYTVEKDENRIVFLDTPGHEAFTAMRMRGAKSTDIAILVVAADDGVMPQTIEAINHAKAAQIPIIVAVNKIDKEDADPDRVLSQLAEHGLTPEDWGGDTLVSKVSALQQLNLEGLLDQILLVSELLDLKADSTVAAEGVIIEAQLDKRRGPLATALVQNGTLKVGDNILIGPVGGRVRALINDYGERVIEAGPATPVEILGLNSVPNAGDTLRVIRDDKEFKQLLSAEKNRDREARLDRRQVMHGLMAPQEEEVEEQDMNFIVKADTQGSTEAVNDALLAMSTDEISIKILHSGTGVISEADVMLASASGAIIIGFNVEEDSNAQLAAERAGVRIMKYDVIYHIAEDVEKIMLGQLSPEVEELETGRFEVREIFKIGKNVIAGGMVTEGKVIRNAAKAIVFRGGKEIFTGKVENLKRFKDDVKEVASGFECGLSLVGFNTFEEGDVIAFYTIEEKQRTSIGAKRSSTTA